MSLSCVIVEDQTMFLQMLHNMLQAMPHLRVAATARTRPLSPAKHIVPICSCST